MNIAQEHSTNILEVIMTESEDSTRSNLQAKLAIPAIQHHGKDTIESTYLRLTMEIYSDTECSDKGGPTTI